MNTERITELEAQLRYHSDAYHNGMPEITDAEFDDLMEELRNLFPESEALIEVGAPVSFGRKVKHPSLMGSLNKVNDSNSLVQWYKTYQDLDSVLVVAPKVDGLAIRLRYVAGKLVEAATRGNGTVGQDVLENAKRIKDIPEYLSIPFTGEVRGEVYMRKDVCKAHGIFANPRNGAAGGILNSDPNETEKRNLNFICYKLEELEKNYHSEEQMLFRAKALGFNTVEMESMNPVHLEAYLQDWEANRRANLPFNIDGLVFSFNSLQEQEVAGWNGCRPRGKMAWKFKPVQAESTVLDIYWQVGRTGKLTPVLRIDPVHVDGSTVSNISLHSASLFDKLALTIGDIVLLQKAGDIIPQVVSVCWRKLNNTKLEVPTNCPSCNSVVERNGAHAWCLNIACPAVLERRILYWLQTQDVKGGGPSVVESMCTSGLVKSISDLYYLNAEKLADVIGSRAIADKVISEILMKSEMPLWKMLVGLAIPGMGNTVSKILQKRYGTIDALLNATQEELESIDGIGSTISLQAVDGLRLMATEIRSLEKVLEIEIPVTGGTLSGKSFCLTGAMSRGRKEIEVDIEKAGGEVKSSVGKGLTYLVTNDMASGSSKNVKAQKLGIVIIDEQNLMNMI